MRAALTNSVKTDTAPDRRAIDPEFQVALKPIFEVLNVEKYCCRTALMTALQLSEIGN